ncbi:hypothetical protein PEC302107_00630 [Pectobacterium araliae]|uniref:Uncharacterized protein n=1 Tax=Pectobacterium araliae TaxID=3073862 RepID=A0AAN0KCD8_9GAMM|nr:hypothetical protein PEC302110_03280 [Pectobacterium sp. MAFF 302110]GKW18334.1 hypothetical protein PEC302107_00630 [Pectobacterium carotovorum subsp. carotovorum]
MTTHNAFQGSHQLKKTLLERLFAHQVAGHIIPPTGAWDGTRGSPSGCTVEGGVELYHSLVGTSTALTWLYDGLSLSGESTDRDEFVLDWLRSIEPGSDLRAIEAAFVLWLLEDDEYGVATFAAGGEVDALLQTLVELYKTLAVGDTPPEQRWRSLREQAESIRLSTENDLAKVLCALVSALAWPAGSSLTLLVDGLAAWQSVHDIHFSRVEGWIDEAPDEVEQTDEEQNEIGGVCYDEATFKELYAQWQADAPEVKREQHTKQLAQHVRNQLITLLSQAGA